MATNTIFYQRVSKEQGVVIDDKRMQVFVCQTCKALIIDKLGHAQNVHKASRIEELNPERVRGSILLERKRLREVGASIRIIGAGKR